MLDCFLQLREATRHMCDHGENGRIDRRGLLALAGLGLAAASLGLSVAPAAAAHGPKTSLNPDQALAALKEGNARYVSSPQVCAMDLIKRRGDLAGHQSPWATIVGCSDSRVPPELLFGGLGPGELFVARNAGNLVDTATMGTVEYGAEVLGAPLLVVLGHEKCGAVAAACDVIVKRATFPGSIGPMVRPIVPAATAMRGKPGDFVDNTVRESARRTAQRLAIASPILSKLVREGKLKIVAARYDLDDGKVEYL
jgi:carbonic anhydrase